ncbi:MAG: hypothetical protein KatS3mg023_1630 [Armatimonadota bacterium]|nr:MAG: hypothetical protein KatS3mg023_1630 [Armatimonadota bacterium]
MRKRMLNHLVVWLVVLLVLPASLAIAQRPIDEAKRQLLETRYRPNRPLVVPAGRLLSSLSRSRQGGDWMRHALWMKPAIFATPGASVVVSPDGQYLAVPTQGLGQVGIYRIAEARWVRFILGHSGEITCLAFSPDGQLLATGSNDHTVKIWRVSDGSLVRTLSGHPDERYYCVAFSPDGQMLASGTESGAIRIWDVSSGSIVRTLTEPDLMPATLAFSPDGQFLVAGARYSLSSVDLLLWRVADGTLVRTFAGHTRVVWSVLFSPDGQTIASAEYDGDIKLWKVSDGAVVRTLTGHTGRISLSYSPDGQTLISGGADGTVKVWQVTTGHLLLTFTAHGSGVSGVAFLPDGQTVASAGSYPHASILLWRAADGSLLREIEGLLGNLSLSLAFSPDGELLAWGDQNGYLYLWRASDGSLVRKIAGHAQGVYAVAFSPDGRLLATGGVDKSVRIWSTEDGSLRQTLVGHTKEVISVAFSEDGRKLASGSSDETIRVWSTSDGSLVRAIVGVTGGARSLCFSPDGSLLFSAGWDNTVKVWSDTDGSLLRSLEGAYAVACSPDGQLVATGSFDSTVKIYRVADGSLVRTLDGFQSPGSVVFSLGGNLLAWTSGANSLRVARISDGTVVQTLEGFPVEVVISLAFSPDGAALASGGRGGVWLWRVQPGAANTPPNPPVLLSPADGATVKTAPFTLTLSATDPEGERLRYKVELLQNGQVVATFDQTRAPDNWDKPSYASGETATLTIPTLAPGRYEWRAVAFDETDWSSASGTRSFTFEPAIQWTLSEPAGDVVQVPIFRVKADIAGLPATERLQYQIEVSRNAQFTQGVVTFDQSVDATMWSRSDYAPGETAGFIARYAFPLYTPLYWRARVRRVGESSWSEPSHAQPFWVVRGFSMAAPTSVRVGRTEVIPVTLTNPYNDPIDTVLVAEVSLNTDEFSGTARVVAPDGTVVDQVELSQEKKYLEAFVLNLPPGTHTYKVEVKVEGSRWSVGNRERVAPLLVFVGKMLAGWAMSFIVESACEGIAREVLRRSGFSEVDANKELGRMADAAQGEVLERAEKRAVQGLQRRGATGLFRKVAGKITPFTNIVSMIGDCVEGITNAFGEGGPAGLSIVRSHDPNMKMGVIGREGFIQAGEPLPYRILFENIPPPPPALPAPAQEVMITDVLDDEIDLSSFTFTAVGFGNHVLTVAPGTRDLSLDVDLRQENKNIVVQIRGSVDEASRKVTVSFRGINPDNGQLHPDGFLPVNQNPPEGEGFVAFEVRLKGDVASGAQIRNKATIVFDVNPPMETNEVVVTVDRVAPQSRVTQISGVSAVGGRCTDCGTQTRGPVEVAFEAEDDVSGVDTVELWYSEERVDSARSRQVGIGGREYHFYRALRSGATPLFRFPGKFGYNYRFYTVARDVAGNKEAEPDDSDARITVGVPPTLPAGLRLVGVPVQSEDPDPKTVFAFEGNKWARYNPTTSNYVLYDNDPAGYTRFAEAEAVPGRGYWVRLTRETVPQIWGPLPDDTQAWSIPLQAGWNQMGNPWLQEMIWDTTAVKVQIGNQVKSLRELRAGEGIEPYLWRWDGSRYRLVYDSTLLPGVENRLPAWEGAWVYAHTDCLLILPPPVSGRRTSAAPITRQHGGAGGWVLSLQVGVQNQRGEVWLGVAEGRDGLTAALPPQPPEETGGLRVSCLRNGVPLAVDVRPDRRSHQSWDVEVRVPSGASDTLMLWWSGIHRVPRGVSPVLVDLQTGERRFLRHTSSYRCAVSREGGVYRFRVELVSQANLLRLSAVQVRSGRARGQYTISFHLNAPAQVEVSVLSAGKVVRRLMSTATRSAGIQQVAWDGRDGNGVALPAGAYMVHIQATGADGQKARASVPVVLTR